MSIDFKVIDEKFYSVIVLKIFKMRKKFIDRDNTIDSIFPYENFEEYYDNFEATMRIFGGGPLVSFSNIDNLFSSVFTQYIMNQLMIFKEKMKDNDAEFKFMDFVRKQVKDNIEELKSIVHENHPETYRKIESMHKDSLFA